MIQVKPKKPNQHALRQLRAATLDAAKVTARLNREVRAVAGTMQELHGGVWSIDIDHDHCYVAVSRDAS